MGFSRQQYWSGLPFPSPWSRWEAGKSTSSSRWSWGCFNQRISHHFIQSLRSARLLCPWDFPVKNTGGGCRFLLQGIFLTQVAKLPPVSCIAGGCFLPLSHQRSPSLSWEVSKIVIAVMKYQVPYIWTFKLWTFKDANMCIPTASTVSEIEACPPSPIADDPSALLSPTSSPSNQQLFLPVHSVSAPIC